MLIGAVMTVSLALATSAFAGSFGVGVSGNMASVTAQGSEAETAAVGTETENSVTSTGAGNKFGFGSVFAEYNFGDSERFTLGLDYVPGSASINSDTLSRTDGTTDGQNPAIQTGTVKANAEISDHVTLYTEIGIVNGVYGKIGFSQVDIDVKQDNSAAYGTYPDKKLDAITLGLGYKAGFGSNGFFKLEGFYSDYDSYTANSSSTEANTVNADLDVVGAKLALGYKF